VIKLHKKVSFASVGFLVALADYPVVVLVPAFYASEFGITLTLIGVIMFLARLLDVFSDPIVGIVSDRFSSFVSYKYWVAISAPFFVFSLALLFYPPSEASPFYLFFMLFALYVFRTALDVPHNAYASSIAENEADRLGLFGYKSAFLVLGVLVSGASVAVSSGELASALSLLSTIALIVFVPIISAFLVCLPRPQPTQPPSWSGIGSWLKVEPDIRSLLTAFFLNQVGNAFAASLVIIYIRDVLHLERYSGLFLASLFLASAVSVPVWIYLSSMFTTLKSWFVAVALSIVVFLSVWFLNEDSYYAYFTVCIVAGCLFGADAVYPPTLLAQLASRNQKDQSKNHGVLFSLKSALSKMSLVVPGIVAFPVIDFFQARSLEGYSNSVVFFYAVFPALFKVAALYRIKVLIHSTK
jgi:GPH family glycoside/pentoside/hexuronide:cation symporter